MGSSKDGYSAGEWILALVIVAPIFWALKSCVSSDEPKAPPVPREIVENSSWDASVKQVKAFLSQNAKDASSIEYLEWSPVQKTNNGGFAVRVKFRAKNSFGAYVLENKFFVLSSQGQVISVSDFEMPPGEQ